MVLFLQIGPISLQKEKKNDVNCDSWSMWKLLIKKWHVMLRHNCGGSLKHEFSSERSFFLAPVFSSKQTLRRQRPKKLVLNTKHCLTGDSNKCIKQSMQLPQLNGPSLVWWNYLFSRLKWQKSEEMFEERLDVFSCGGGITISGCTLLRTAMLPYLVLFCLSGLCSELGL